MFFCQACNINVHNYSSHKKTNIHKSNNLIKTQFDNIRIIACAFKNKIVSYKITPQSFTITPEKFLSEITDTCCYLIKELLKQHVSLKVNFELFVSYNLPKNNEISLKSFNTRYTIILQSTDILSTYQAFAEKILNKCSEFELSESGWTIESISHLEINFVKYSPLRAGSYLKLPKRIQNTKSCLNIVNKDNYCFLWSIVAYLYPAMHNSNRVTSYPHYLKVLNTSNMTFPPSLDDIKLFEDLNPNVSVNVYGLEQNDYVTGPLYKTLKRKLFHVNLLYINNNGKSHFCLIKHFSKLVHRQLTKHKSKIYLCDECFMYFETSEKHLNHSCARVQTILPEENSKLCFSNFNRTQRVPIVIYGDFESLLREYSDKNKSPCVENIQIHEASCYGYYIFCQSKPELNKFRSYRGPDCSKKFIEAISRDVIRLYKLMSEIKPMIINKDQQTALKNAKQCHICKKSFNDTDSIVADHDHFTGMYRGPAHNTCNLNTKSCPFIPIIFHNLSGYDCHLFIKELSAVCGRINLIPKNKEKYISFTKFIPIDKKNVAQLKFIDSFNFLSSSLDNLIKSMKTKDFQNLREFFKDDYLFKLACKKGVYCYDYINSWLRYEETELPDSSKFYNKLTSQSISDEDYNHALKVWNAFNISNLGEYTDLYLKCDVLLLCDVFEKFRTMSLQYYNLDPCYYVSSPSLSWDAMLLYTKINLDLISDIDMYQMLEKGIRGGLAQCSLRYAKANNKYLPNYNNKEPDSYLIYLDCVNLYGHAMMQQLPTRNFRFLNEDEINNFKVMHILNDSKTGFILEVDLWYPYKIHEAHSDLPFAAEKFAPPGSRNDKLIANLYDKHKYIIHYVHLKECIKNGLILLKIYRILSFEQSAFLAPYILLNTTLRQKASSDFERDFFKKQNNSIFGKTIENKRKQVDVKLVNVWKDIYNKTNKLCGAEKYVSAPNFKNLSIFSDSLVAIQLQQTKIVLDRPIYIGFTILELAKTHLYSFHYSVMKRLYQNRIQLCYTDTDSLLYLIYTENFYEDMKKNIKYFDTSNFENGNQFNIHKANSKIPGFFKDEMGGDIISEFVGLRAKLYCIDSLASSVIKAKGVKSSTVKKLDIKKYKRALQYNECLRDDMCIIKSKNHNIFTQKINKLVLSRDDDKRQIMEDGSKTLPWGHHKTVF